ncbi:unnamed protein product [Amoebophrya sp. A120]|nr:unnamed protein product [Amoebophrya sp. A120]|eukprot:GSA120T00011223001.1
MTFVVNTKQLAFLAYIIQIYSNQKKLADNHLEHLLQLRRNKVKDRAMLSRARVALGRNSMAGSGWTQILCRGSTSATTSGTTNMLSSSSFFSTACRKNVSRKNNFLTSPKRFFSAAASPLSEQVFWSSPHLIGPVFLFLLFSFPLYRGVKDLYWTATMRRLNRAEIVQDRFEWLQASMLQDEVAACVAGQAAKYEDL